MVFRGVGAGDCLFAVCQLFFNFLTLKDRLHRSDMVDRIGKGLELKKDSVTTGVKVTRTYGKS